jgi:hypothetical protein
VLLETLTAGFRKARSVNQTSATFVSKVPTGTEPAGDAGTATGASVFDIAPTGASGGAGPNAVLVMPYAVGADNTTFSVRAIGWRLIGSDPATLLWVPTLLVELACTASAVVGVAGRAVVATERFADTITLTTGNDDVSVDIVSPTGDVAGHALVDIKGCQKLEFSFSTGSSATSCNALFSPL